MKKYYILLLFLMIGSITSLGQQRNLLFSYCNIGDNISRLGERFYCKGSKGLNQNLNYCPSRQFRFFPVSGDSLAFPVIKFSEVLIIGDEENSVNNIWLVKLYKDDTQGSADTKLKADYDLLVEY